MDIGLAKKLIKSEAQLISSKTKRTRKKSQEMYAKKLLELGSKTYILINFYSAENQIGLYSW